MIVDEEQGILRVPMSILTELAHPLETNPWTGFPLTVEDVLSCEHEAQESCYESCGPYEGCDDCELARIAHFVRSGWDSVMDDAEPITVDVGLGDYFPEWIIVDGNHRVAAAIVLGMTHIEVCIEGSWDRALVMFSGGDWQDVY